MTVICSNVISILRLCLSYNMNTPRSYKCAISSCHHSFWYCTI